MTVTHVLIAAVAALAVVLGLHLFLMLAATLVAAAVLLLAWRIDMVTMETGWGVRPYRKARSW